MHLERTDAGFRTTRWTLLGRLSDPVQRAAAMDTLVRTYWPAVYASLRRSGRPREDAAELTQAFFSEVVLGRALLNTADPTRGRLRSLILTALNRFAVDQHRRRTADPARNGPALADLDLEEAIFGAAPASDPDAAFDRRWALVLFNQALERTERHFRESGKARNWEAFAARIVGPALGSCEPLPLARIAQEQGFANAADAAAAVQTVKKRVMAVLQELVAQTTDDPGAAHAEFSHILALLA